MFGIPGKPPVEVTPTAAAQIARLAAKDGKFGLKLGVKKGGCAGMEYTMDYVDAAEPHDEVVAVRAPDGAEARVVIAPMAQMFLFGTVIDFESKLLESGFVFRNPNVTEACGCGESIKFDDALTAPAPGAPPTL